jgi:hypothetical protein
MLESSPSLPQPPSAAPSPSNSARKAFELLGECADVVSLETALRAICAEFGALSCLDVLISRRGGKHRALCFLRMVSPADENKLIEQLRFGRFGGNLVAVVDLKTDPPNGSRSEAAQPNVPDVFLA